MQDQKEQVIWGQGGNKKRDTFNTRKANTKYNPTQKQNSTRYQVSLPQRGLFRHTSRSPPSQKRGITEETQATRRLFQQSTYNGGNEISGKIQWGKRKNGRREPRILVVPRKRQDTQTATDVVMDDNMMITSGVQGGWVQMIPPENNPFKQGSVGAGIKWGRQENRQTTASNSLDKLGYIQMQQDMEVEEIIQNGNFLEKRVNTVGGLQCQKLSVDQEQGGGFVGSRPTTPSLPVCRPVDDMANVESPDTAVSKSRSQIKKIEQSRQKQQLQSLSSKQEDKSVSHSQYSLSEGWTDSETFINQPGDTETVQSPKEPKFGYQVPSRVSGGDGLDDTEDDEWIVQAGDGSKEYIQGVCEQMCSKQEFDERKSAGDSRRLERVDPVRHSSFSEDLAVSKFKRTVEAKPELLRTRKALQKTMRHLRALLDCTSNLPSTAQFLEDAYRAVRQDLSIQGIRSTFAIRLCEEMTRFMIMIHHELCLVQATVENKDGFDAHLNMEQLNKTLTTLMSMYQQHRTVGQSPIASEKEFVCYDLLMKLSAHGRFNYNPFSLHHVLNALPPEMLATPELQFALHARRLVYMNDFVGFFRLLQQGTYLQACLLHLYVDQLRIQGVETIISAARVGGRPIFFPVVEFQKQLMFDNQEQVEQYCKDHSIQIQNNTTLKLNDFSVGETASRTRSEIISKKAPESLSLVLIGKLQAQNSQSIRALSMHNIPNILSTENDSQGPQIGSQFSFYLQNQISNNQNLQLTSAQFVPQQQNISSLFYFNSQPDQVNIENIQNKQQQEDLKQQYTDFCNMVQQQSEKIQHDICLVQQQQQHQFQYQQQLQQQQMFQPNQNNQIQQQFGQQIYSTQPQNFSVKRARVENVDSIQNLNFNPSKKQRREDKVDVGQQDQIQSVTKPMKSRKFGIWSDFDEISDESSGAEEVEQKKLQRGVILQRWQRAFQLIKQHIKNRKYWKKVLKKADQPQQFLLQSTIKIRKKDLDPFGYGTVLKKLLSSKHTSKNSSPLNDFNQKLGNEGIWSDFDKIRNESSGAEEAEQKKIQRGVILQRWQRAFQLVKQHIKNRKYWKKVLKKANQPQKFLLQNTIKFRKKDLDPFEYRKVLNKLLSSKHTSKNSSPLNDFNQKLGNDVLENGVGDKNLNQDNKQNLGASFSFQFYNLNQYNSCEQQQQQLKTPVFMQSLQQQTNQIQLLDRNNSNKRRNSSNYISDSSFKKKLKRTPMVDLKHGKLFRDWDSVLDLVSSSGQFLQKNEVRTNPDFYVSLAPSKKKRQ